MRFLFAVMVLACTPAFGQGPPAATLKDWCQDHNNGGGDVECQTYLRGVMDGVAMAKAGNEANARICFPQGVTLPQVRSVVEKYMAQNPEKLHAPSAAVAFPALFLAFPCQISNADEPHYIRPLGRVGTDVDPKSRVGSPKRIQQELDKASAQVKADEQGELGRRARGICGLRVGIPKNPPLLSDSEMEIVISKYGPRKAKDYTDCVVSEMYPVPPK
jgi:Rap1a immunity proteins